VTTAILEFQISNIVGNATKMAPARRRRLQTHRESQIRKKLPKNFNSKNLSE